MKFSVITVCLNARATIGEAIASVHAQTWPEVEHIVIDGASTDGTLDVLEQHRGRIARLISEPDRGLYFAMNKGLALATGDVVGVLNSDDVYADPKVLEYVATAFRDPQVDICYGDIYYVDIVNVDRVIRHWVSVPFRTGLFENGWMPPHPAFFIRREALQRVGMFEEAYRYAADFDFMLRALQVHRLRSVYLPRVLVKMRVGGETNKSIANVLRGNIEAYRACRRHGLKVSPLFMFKKILRKLPQFRAI